AARCGPGRAPCAARARTPGATRRPSEEGRRPRGCRPAGPATRPCSRSAAGRRAERAASALRAAPGPRLRRPRPIPGCGTRCSPPPSQPLPKQKLSARIDGAPEPSNRKRSIHMIHAGDTIYNPATGERIVFRQTSRETNGEAAVIETFVQPNGFVAAAHLHPSQEERFEILRGSVGFRVGRKKLVAGPGQRLTVAPRTPPQCWN